MLFSNGCDSFSGFPCFGCRDSFETSWSGILESVPQLELCVFLMIKLEDHRGEVPLSSHVIKGTCVNVLIYHCWCQPPLPGRQRLSGFSTLSSVFLPLLCRKSLKEEGVVLHLFHFGINIQSHEQYCDYEVPLCGIDGVDT